MLKATCRTKERTGWRVGHVLDLSKPTATQNIILNRAAQIVPSGPQKGKKNPSPPTLHQNQLWPPPLWSALPNPAYKLPVSLAVCEVFGVLYICGLSRLCPCPYPSARGRGVWEQLLCPAEHSFLFLTIPVWQKEQQTGYGHSDSSFQPLVLRQNAELHVCALLRSGHAVKLEAWCGDPSCCTIWLANRATPTAVTSYFMNPNCRDQHLANFSDIPEVLALQPPRKSIILY